MDKSEKLYTTAAKSARVIAVTTLTGVAFAVCLLAFEIATIKQRDTTLNYMCVAALCAIVAIVIFIGKYAVAALKKARLETEIALRVQGDLMTTIDGDAETFRVFHEISRKISGALDADTIFKTVTDIAPTVVPSCGRLMFLLYDHKSNRLTLRHIAGYNMELAVGMEFSPDTQGLYASALKNRRLENYIDISAMEHYRFDPNEPKCPSARSLIVIPLMSGDRCIGLFSAESGEVNHFTPDIESALVTIIEIASMALTRARLHREIEDSANTDDLSGLNARRVFQETITAELDRARRYNRPLSLLMVDIDRFKSLNDTHGYRVGDLIISEIAACIRGTVRYGDFPARYGGEEFAVLLPETNEQEAYLMAERMRMAVEDRAIEMDGKVLHVTISIGGITFPKYGQSEQELIEFAAQALYTSKNSGRNKVSMYYKEMAVWDVLDRR